MNEFSQHPIVNWIPYKLRIEQQEWLFEWLYVEGKRFTEPFFDETIGKCKSLKENSKRMRTVCDYESLIWQESTVKTIKPTAIIFHVSRCGSTLLSQLLGINENWISLSEIPLFDEILRASYKYPHVTETAIKEALKASISLVGKRRYANEECLFVKTDSWHLFFYKIYRELYPDVPFVFLYRSPDEVIRSHRRLRGMQAVPGLIEPEIFGFSKNEIPYTDLDGYMAQVLIKYQQKFLEIAEIDTHTHFINYNEGGVAMIQTLLRAANLTVDQETYQKIVERSSYHSKFPDKPFAEIRNEELQVEGLDEAIRLYRQLEEKCSNKKVI